MRVLGVVCGLLCAFGCNGDGMSGDGGSSGGGGVMAGTVAGSGGARCQDQLAPLPRAPDCALAWRGYTGFYDNVVVRYGCASGVATCHGQMGGMAGLYLFDRDMAYDYLLGNIDGKARVVPGDPECSLLAKRVESDRDDYRMPPGPTPLPEQTRCSIITWIAEGALKE